MNHCITEKQVVEQTVQTVTKTKSVCFLALMFQILWLHG
jgi:hypothetical protein